MPADYTINAPYKIVLSRGTGVFTYADFLDHGVRLRSDPNFNPDFKQLIDCREITVLDLNSGQVAELAGESVFSTKSRRAFLVSTALHFGMSRMFATYRELAGQQVAVFKELPDALEWLELPADLDLGAAAKPGANSRDTKA